MQGKLSTWLLAGVMTVIGTSVCPAAVTLVENGTAKACVVVSPAVLALKPDPAKRADPMLLRLAAEDLVTYVRKMSGAELPLVAQPSAGQLPVYVGCAPAKPPLGVKSRYGDAYVIAIGPDAIALDGESARAVYYAAARLLHALGVRWYAPGDLGEHVPKQSTLVQEPGRTESTPSYHTRGLWGNSAASNRWLLRNRMGGPIVAQGHAFDGYLTHGKPGPKVFAEHPEYFPVQNGKPYHGQANLSNPQVAELFAEQIAANFRKGPTHWAGGKSAGIGPDDGMLIDERPESRALMCGRLNPMFQIPEATDLLVRFVNQVAAKLEPEFPDHTLGFYVYSNHTLPPLNVKPNRKMIVPVMAPIAYSRYSSIGNPRSPTSMMLKDHILQWKSMVDEMGFYLYNFNLADTAMPFTRTLAFGKDLRNLHAWGLREATIESMDNWHLMVPGNYVIASLLWDVNCDLPAVLDELYRDYYGPAAAAMRRYNTVLETACEDTDAFAGAQWSTHRILTPQVMEKLERAYRDAESAAKRDPLYARRVGVTRYTLDFAKHWLAARAAINSFEFAKAAQENEAFVATCEQASLSYPGFFSPAIVPYWKSYHYQAFKDAGRVANEGDIVYRLPDEMLAYLDAQKIGASLGLYTVECGTQNWTRLRTYSAMIDEQGFPFFRGLVWYRHAFTLPRRARKAAAVRLWLGGLDGGTDVYLNGKKLAAPPVKGNFGTLDVDLTADLKREGENVLVFAVDNTGITELGTAGLVRPGLLYVPKAAPAAKAATTLPAGTGTPQPLFAPK